MSAGEPSKDSAAFCADLVRTHDFARYAATLFLPAIRTYNIMLGERRRVAAALIAVP